LLGSVFTRKILDLKELGEESFVKRPCLLPNMGRKDSKNKVKK